MQNIEVIDLNQLADILAAATIASTINTPGMLVHEINHPTIGKATTAQAGNDALLIRGLGLVTR